MWCRGHTLLHALHEVEIRVPSAPLQRDHVCCTTLDTPSRSTDKLLLCTRLQLGRRPEQQLDEPALPSVN